MMGELSLFRAHFSDVKLECNDGQIFQCNKCLLVARLEYFRHMFLSGVWLEVLSCGHYIWIGYLGRLFGLVIWVDYLGGLLGRL